MNTDTNPTPEQIAQRVMPCPFCGGAKATPEIIHPDQNWHSVHCHYCGASGPSAGTDEDAVKYWNEQGPIATLRERADALAGALEGYANMTRLEPPAGWNCFKAGGMPEISDYAEEDTGGPARVALADYRATLGVGEEPSNPSNSLTDSRESHG